MEEKDEMEEMIIITLSSLEAGEGMKAVDIAKAVGGVFAEVVQKLDKLRTDGMITVGLTDRIMLTSQGRESWQLPPAPPRKNYPAVNVTRELPCQFNCGRSFTRLAWRVKHEAECAKNPKNIEKKEREMAENKEVAESAASIAKRCSESGPQQLPTLPPSGDGKFEVPVALLDLCPMFGKDLKEVTEFIIRDWLLHTMGYEWMKKRGMMK